MERWKSIMLGALALAIFAFVGVASQVVSQQTPIDEAQREAAEWFREVEVQREISEAQFEDFLTCPDPNGCIDTGDDCSGTGWCPPSCSSCSGGFGF